MGNIFISFLGTNNYKECKYTFGQEESSTVKYVQEHIINTKCREWNEDDEILIFVTEGSKSKNWLNADHKDKDGNIIPNKGLEERLSELKLKASVKDIPIPAGKSEAEIWMIFENISNQFKKNSYKQVIIDVTHSFRSLPMLMITLIPYLKTLRKIEDLSVFYGAFEALDPNTNTAPVFDLTPLTEVQEWTFAVRNFMENGISKNISDLMSKEFESVKKNKKDKQEQTLSNVSKSLQKLTEDILICYGSSIGKFNYDKLKNDIDEAKIINKRIPPLNPLLDKVKEKINRFKTNDYINNGFTAIEWCIQHGLIQQGYTLLREFIISYFLDLLEGYSWDSVEKDERETLSAVVQRMASRGKLDDLKKRYNESVRKDVFDKTVQIMEENEFLMEFAGHLQNISDFRNAIDHGFFKKSVPKKDAFDKYREKLTVEYEKVKAIINEIEAKGDHKNV